MHFAENRLTSLPHPNVPDISPIQPVLDSLSLTPNAVVAAMGSQSNRFTFPLGRYFDRKNGSGMVFACEFTSGGIDHLRNKIRDAHIERHVVAQHIPNIAPYRLPIENDLADTIIAINSQPFQQASESFIKECLRILKPCGKLLLGRWTDKTSLSDSQRFAITRANAWQRLKEADCDICTDCDISGLDWSIMVVKPLVQVVL